ncbi:cell division protein FtsB [Sediminihabitans luteus]|uniref:Cell division protein FtsB n=1 Tax=Sediminihabitans luteus TaxID=1138585 RepID=A0A2M9CDC7_9CELL|nr:septum formation initiator family protein [Sediminihabitans luteus]PJJ69889.1 cell division protein FtsB [Sediminihabitans luteus]GII99208.1 hypothetical protein Slu03_15860 [Sediminihabitans luteus]
MPANRRPPTPGGGARPGARTTTSRTGTPRTSTLRGGTGAGRKPATPRTSSGRAGGSGAGASGAGTSATGKGTTGKSTAGKGTAAKGAAGKGTTGKSTAAKSPASSTGSARPSGTSAAGGRARNTPRDTRPQAPHEASRSRFGAVLPEVVTARALVLSVVILLAIVVLLPTVRAYVNQSADLRALEADLAQAKADRDAYQVELDRWDDSSYVIAQARERLSFVMPGETAYRVMDPQDVDEVVDPGTGLAITDGPVPAGGASDPWYESLWDSVEVAGTVGEPDAEVPAGDAPSDAPSGGPSGAPTGDATDDAKAVPSDDAAGASSAGD